MGIADRLDPRVTHHGTAHATLIRMRRLVFPIIVAAGLVVIGAGSASAEQAPTGKAASAVPGKKICKITDPKLDELSGIVAIDSGFIVIDDSTTLSDHRRVFYLNNECAITKSVRYGGNGPRDTEDMILSPDGKTLWIADTGDNDRSRATVGLWSMPVDGSSSPRIHRLAYPDGKHDAEALLLGGDGTPIIVTKEVGKQASIYTPAAALKTDNLTGVPLQKVGEITVPESSTSANAISRIGRLSIDGGAIAPGGERVTLRTYTDALEWTVKSGDVLAAIKGTPRVTPLPDEPLGEAITYSPDGKYFYTVSDMQGQPASGDNYILQYTPASAVTKAAADPTAAAKGGSSFLSNLTLQDITYLVIAIGVLGAILVGLGIFGIVRARRNDEFGHDGAGGPGPRDPQTEFGGRPGGSQPGVYGGGAQSGSGVYGARSGAVPAGGAGAGGVYGGSSAPGRRGASPPYGGAAGAGAAGGRAGAGSPDGSRTGAAYQGGGRGGAGSPGGGRGAGSPGVDGSGSGGRYGAGQPPARPGRRDQPGYREQPGGRPGSGGQGRPDQGGQPGRGGVYGSPPPERNAAAGPAQRPRAYTPGPGSYAEANGVHRSRDYDNPTYGRSPYGR